MSMPAYSLIRRLAVAFMGVLVSNRSMTGGGRKLGTKVHTTAYASICTEAPRGHCSLKSKTSVEISDISGTVLPSCGYLQYVYNMTYTAGLSMQFLKRLTSIAAISLEKGRGEQLTKRKK